MARLFQYPIVAEPLSLPVPGLILFDGYLPVKVRVSFQYLAVVEPLSLSVPSFGLFDGYLPIKAATSRRYLESVFDVFPRVPSGWATEEFQLIRKHVDSTYLMRGGVINPITPTPPPPTSGCRDLLPLLGVQ